MRSSVQYIGVRPPQTALRTRIREITEVRVSYGYRRITVLLRREGWRVNAKRVYRLYKEEGLGLRGSGRSGGGAPSYGSRARRSRGRTNAGAWTS